MTCRAPQLKYMRHNSANLTSRLCTISLGSATCQGKLHTITVECTSPYLNFSPVIYGVQRQQPEARLASLHVMRTIASKARRKTNASGYVELNAACTSANTCDQKHAAAHGQAPLARGCRLRRRHHHIATCRKVCIHLCSSVARMHVLIPRRTTPSRRHAPGM
jgi:hypothetical protein